MGRELQFVPGAGCSGPCPCGGAFSMSLSRIALIMRAATNTSAIDRVDANAVSVPPAAT